MDNLRGSPVMRALSELPEAFGQAIYLSDVEGYRYHEIAEIMDTPLGTVMSRIHRGRAMLREKLSAHAAGRGAVKKAQPRAAVQRARPRESVPAQPADLATRRARPVTDAGLRAAA